jgi:tripartite ATP-independent transporter DctM subunit
MNAGLIVFLLLVVLAFLGLPIFLAIGVATMAAMFSAGFPLQAVAQKTFLGLNSSALLSIPFFILAGNLMAQGITQKLIAASNVVLGRVRGSLGAVTILASGLFGAISGSAVATVAAIGGMTIPAMEEEGYDKNYAAACASSASLLGPMIPPSISLIVYASLTQCSIQELFMATAVPGVLCTVAYLAYTLYYGYKHNLPKQEKKTRKEALMIFKDSIWALFMPILVLGTIFGGICTVTESAAISAIYSAVVGVFIYKTIDFKSLLKIIYDSAVAVSAIMILIGLSKASAYVVIASQLPQLFMESVSSFTSNAFVVLLIINAIFLILGCLMEGNSIIVMMVPLMLNLVNLHHINLVQFGILTCFNIYIGCITPPVGISLLVGTKIARTSMGRTFIECMPFLATALIILILVTYVPSVSLWLPSVLLGN